MTPSFTLVPSLETAWQDVDSGRPSGARLGPNQRPDRLPWRQGYVRRPRVHSYDGHELALPTWTAAVQLPEGDLPALAGYGTSKSAASRRFVALSDERLAEWLASDLSELDLLVIQIDGLYIGNDLILV